MNKETPLIINLNSGTAKAKFADIKGRLDNKYVFKVKDPKQFKNAYKAALKLKPKTIVLAGGDGTIIKGVEALTSLGYGGSFAILPFGTANYLARDLGVPLGAEEAIERAIKGKPKEVPLATVNNHYFALMMTVGLSRLLSSNISDSLKQRLGQMAYVLELFKQSKAHQAFTYKIQVNDSKKPLRGTSHQIVVYNSDLNQQLKLLPDHKLKSPELKLVVTKTGKSITKLYLVFLIHILTFGRIRLFMKVTSAKKLRITTKPLQPAGLDGEVIDADVFTVKAAAQTVKVVC